jgi:dihydrofolate synthase/folylpolyglutamate synthase
MFQRVGKAAYKANLDNTVALCNTLDNPQNNFPSVHIAGTNGKGSVSHFIASVLQSSGLKVGLYTSPHLKDFRERIKVNGRKIPKKYVTGFVNSHKEKFSTIKPSFFEYTFGMAIKYFSDEKIDIAIMETGMGGRLDSTNVVSSIVSVITNIGLDHTQFLGDTLQKIAIEKAGIIKPGIPVVIGQTQKETESIFIDFANKNDSSILFADQNFTILNCITDYNNSPKLILDILSVKNKNVTGLISGLAGFYQQKNIVTAFQTIDILKSLEFTISENNIKDGFRNVVKQTGITGRWQILNKKPLTICDTGHNIDGLKEIISQINKTPHNKLHFVIGMVNDKDIDRLLELFPKKATYYFCKARIPRALDQELLKRKARQYELPGKSFISVSKAYANAVSNADADDLIFIGGSTFVVAEVL